MDAISIDAAVAITGLSRRTLWRRVTEGTISKRGEDGRGRAMLSLTNVVDLMSFSVDGDDFEMLVRADDGDAEAQADVGAMFYSAGEFDAAVFWLNAAAAQQNGEAMHWLATCHFAGHGVPKNENLGLSWIARAADAGHLIAQHQIDAIRQSALK